MRISPNAFDTLAPYASWGLSFGKPEAGGEAADRAIRLMAGRYADSVKVMERLVARGTELYAGHVWNSLPQDLETLVLDLVACIGDRSCQIASWPCQAGD